MLYNVIKVQPNFKIPIHDYHPHLTFYNPCLDTINTTTTTTTTTTTGDKTLLSKLINQQQ
jgi:hypothetical protein